MTPETFCEHFATFAEAPNGVAKLRELILQLAIQGKLGTQDVNDEPAEELLTKIQRRSTEKGERDSVSRKSVRPSVNSNRGSGALPRGWIQTRLGNVAEIIMGNSPPGSSYNEHGEGVPLINGPVEFSEGPFGLTVRTKFTTEPTKFCKKDDLLICVRGSTTGRTNVAAFDACIGRGVAAVQAGDVQFYVNLFVLALRQAIFDMGTGSTFPSISYNQIADIPFPLPPLAEQRRIVEKVDQLLGLCDELAARQAARREARSALVGATLDRLVSARSSAEFPAHAHRLRDHFDRLFDTPTTLPQLRQAILQLAVQGQLVPQDPNDEPVRVLDSDAMLTDEQLPEIPSTWKYRRTAEVVAKDTAISYGIVLPGPNQPEGVPYIRGQDIDDAGNIHVDQLWKTTAQIAAKHRRSELLEGDVLLCVIRHLRSAIVPEGLDGANLTQGTVRLRPSKEIFGPYLAWYLASPQAQRWMKAKYTGMSMPRINVAHAREIPIALPPLSEQKRIVSKVTELLSLCDALEAKLTQAESASTQLLSAAVHHLLNQERVES